MEQELNGLILSMEGVNFIDAEGADMLKKIAQVGSEKGIDLHLSRVKPQVKDVLQRNGVIDIIGDEHIHAGISAAVRMHMTKYPSDSKDFQDLLDLLEQAKL